MRSADLSGPGAFSHLLKGEIDSQGAKAADDCGISVSSRPPEFVQDFTKVCVVRINLISQDMKGVGKKVKRGGDSN